MRTERAVTAGPADGPQEGTRGGFDCRSGGAMLDVGDLPKAGVGLAAIAATYSSARIMT
jgi:hypothetical protein